jgi:hypothetical protein
MTTPSHSEPHSRYWFGVFAIMAIVLVTLASLSNSWMVSCIGDEWAIYQRATSVALGPRNLAAEIIGPLSSGLWGVHMPFLTFLQGVVLYIGGINNFSWRMASVLSFVLSIPPLFIVTRVILSRRAALLACAFMAFSYYLLAEALWGYGWTLLRLFSLWHAALLALFLCKPTFLRALALGVSLTCCSLSGALCTYITPLTFVVLIGCALFRLRPSAWKYTTVVALTYLLTHTLPIRLWSTTDDLKTTMQLTLSKTSLGPILQRYFGEELFSRIEGQARTVPEVLELLGTRFVETLTAPVTMIGGSHYLFGTLIHPVVGGLALVGFVLAIVWAFRSWAWRLVLLFYIPAVILAGALSPYASPAITRVHFLVPFWALFAAAAIEYGTRRLPRAAFAIIGTGLVGTTMVWAYDRLFAELPHTPRFTAQAYAVQIMQAYPDRKIAFLYGNWHPLDFVLEPYGLKERSVLCDQDNSDELLSQVAKDPSALVVLLPESASNQETVRTGLCGQQQSSTCSCKPCGGRGDRPMIVCGSFECVIDSTTTLKQQD